MSAVRERLIKMNEIGDLFGNYSDPYRKKKLKQLAEQKETPGKVRSKGPKEKNCSCCGSNWAWHSSDDGKTWQCREHKI